MQNTIKFGTDGWRGFVAEDYTFDNVRRCSQGFANYLIEAGNQGKEIIVGHDKRGRVTAGFISPMGVASAERSPLPLRARAKNPSNTKLSLPWPDDATGPAHPTSSSPRYGENCWRSLVTET